jgi:hypothetical protein
MKQKVRLSIGLFHYVAGLALFATPWLGREYSEAGVVDSAIGVAFIGCSAFSRFELGVLKLLSYREHLYTILTLSLLLGAFSVSGISAGDIQFKWMLLAAISVVLSAWSLRLHLVNRRRIVLTT